MNFKKLDEFQSRHPIISFPLAVVHKYSDDQAGNQAALLTYYGFLSLFPLLLVATTVLQIVALGDQHLQEDIINAITGNSTALADQLTAHILGLHRNGVALFVGIIFLIYGARGVASAFRNGANHLWGIPRDKMLGFPRSIIKDLTIILVGGLGLVAAAGVTGAVAAYGHGNLPRILSYFADGLILYVLFNLLYKMVLARKADEYEIHLASLITALGLVAMQILGGYILAKVLKNLDALYSYFAVSLGLLFWIYLQAQVVYYSMEVALVKHRKLWPIKLIK